MFQTSVQRKSAIRFGSCKIEIGDDVPGLEDIGIVKNVVFTEELTFSDRGADNADLIRFLRKVRAIVTGDQEELDLEMIFKLRGEIDSYSIVAGTEVAGVDQVVYAGQWHYNDFIQIENQMGDKTQPTINSVTGSTDGALVEDTDYYVGKDDDGDWGIFIIDSVTVTTEDQNITINYDYTPNAAKKLESGGSGVEMTPKIVRLTNNNEAGKVLRLTLWKAFYDANFNITFQPDEGEEPALNPFTLLGVPDISKAAGKQVYEIYDEQSIT
ncbi:MAG: hypothetical protein AMS17_18650 [Spirochaetes bacterium DG_61]|jgi:hypothetical protein|nr:MAG: hypothetical protein AMS17_18650 [Spirochaetes bacterium DG_61]